MEKQFVIFELLHQKYAVEIEVISEITNLKEVTPVPNANVNVEGVMNLRGKVVPLIRLSKVFGQKTDLSSENQILILNHGDQEIGMIIDSAKDVRTFPDTDIQPLAAMLGKNGHVIGTIHAEGELIQLISLERIMALCGVSPAADQSEAQN